MADPPRAELSHLPRADGSATFRHGGYTVIASANGPIENSRRDDDPLEGIVDVIVYPAAGPGGTGERYLESVLQAALRQLIALRDLPRCLVQVTLQLIEAPVDDYALTKNVKPQQDLAVIPALFHAALLALISAAVPLLATATATTIAVPQDGGPLTAAPLASVVRKARSFHVFAFTSRDEMLLSESEGCFSLAEWLAAVQLARRVAIRPPPPVDDLDGRMEVDADESLNVPDVLSFMRAIVQRSVDADLYWIEDGRHHNR